MGIYWGNLFWESSWKNLCGESFLGIFVGNICRESLSGIFEGNPCGEVFWGSFIGKFLWGIFMEKSLWGIFVENLRDLGDTGSEMYEQKTKVS